MANKKVILAVVNRTYVKGEVMPNTLDLFLEGLKAEEGTSELVNHLLIVAVDQIAYDQYLLRNLHCYKLETDGVDFTREEVFMSFDFVKMMWRRTLFLLEVLEKGYDFFFTDIDVLWLRNPFTVISTSKTRSCDIQFSTDCYYNDHPSSTRNPINTGFYFVKLNNKTIFLFNKWYNLKDNSHGEKEQNVLQKLIKHGILRKLSLNARFLDTKLFSGFCEDSSVIESVITVHANCCRFTKAKVADLSQLLREWAAFKVIAANATSSFRWSPHSEYRNSWSATYGND